MSDRPARDKQTKHTHPGTRTTHIFQAIGTRNEAFKSVVWDEHGVLKVKANERGLGSRQQAVFEVLLEYPGGLTNNEIAERLNWPINRVTPRVYELRGLGSNSPCPEEPLVVPAEKRDCSVTGNTAQAWVAAVYKEERDE